MIFHFFFSFSVDASNKCCCTTPTISLCLQTHNSRRPAYCFSLSPIPNASPSPVEHSRAPNKSSNFFVVNNSNNNFNLFCKRRISPSERNIQSLLFPPSSSGTELLKIHLSSFSQQNNNSSAATHTHPDSPSPTTSKKQPSKRTATRISWIFRRFQLLYNTQIGSLCEPLKEPGRTSMHVTVSK